ncbi:MAG: hypothetical protein J7K20_04235 [Thermodesulfobacterium sp.]|nr:hypothetical protein [Thermodesulfobacterium sp.]
MCAQLINVNKFNFDFAGCGALNWDIFFEVEDLSELKIEHLKISPGREVVLERKRFLNFFNFLEKKGEILFECGGGSSANTIYALASWGFNCCFIGSVGEDSFGKRVIEEFEKIGVDTSFIIKSSETSLAAIILDKKKDRFIAVSPGSSENVLSDLEIKLNHLKTFFHFSSFASKSGQEFQKRLFLKLKFKSSFDPGEVYANLGKDFLLPLLKKTEILFITEYELKKTGLSLEELLDLGISKIFLKRGKEGAVFYSKKIRIELPALEIEKIVDNTGAGDYFDAGVLAGLRLGLSEEKALKIGIYSAGFSLRDFGRKSCLTKEEFQKYVNLLK